MSAGHDRGRPAANQAASNVINGDTSSVTPVPVDSSQWEHGRVAPFITGLDGKEYPRRPLDGPTRLRVIAEVHYLRHGGLTIRDIAAMLEAETGVRRSVGSVCKYLAQWRCDHCSGGPIATPEHAAGGAA